MPKILTPTFRHKTLEDIYTWLATNEKTYGEAAKRWGYNDPASARYFLLNQNTNRTIAILEDWAVWKQES
jgi:hypothetical protein